MEIEESYDGVYRGLSVLESCFNIVDGVPVAGLFSGMARGAAGAVQAVVGGIFVVLLGQIGQTYCSNENRREWKNFTFLGYQNVGHGLLNMLRGGAAFLVGTTVIYSPVFWGFQFVGAELTSSPRLFAPLVPYSRNRRVLVL